MRKKHHHSANVKSKNIFSITSRAPRDSSMLLTMRRMLEMHKEQRSQWKRDAIDLSVDPSDHACEDLPTP